MIHFRVEGLQEADDDLRRLAHDNPQATDRAMWRWAQRQRQMLKAKGYPPQLRAPQPFKTERSRRYFFWALGEGIISVPYRRTGRLANAFRAERLGLMEVAITVANSAPWAAMVVGRGTQTHYHAGHWWIMQDEVEASTPDLTEAIRAELMGLVE